MTSSKEDIMHHAAHHAHDRNRPQHHHNHKHAQPQPGSPRDPQGAPNEQEGPGTVLLIGGIGGMSEHYRAIVEKRGLVLRHYEKRVPPGMRHTIGKVAAV